MTQLDELKSCGIVIQEEAIPVKYRVAEAAAFVGRNIGHIGNTSEADIDKVLIVALMSEAVKRNPAANNEDRGCAKSLAECFGVSRKIAKKVIQETASETSQKIIASRSKKLTVMDTKWPALVNEFCFTKPICREAPGECVSCIWVTVRKVQTVFHQGHS